jgi:hypothetical protein
VPTVSLFFRPCHATWSDERFQYSGHGFGANAIHLYQSQVLLSLVLMMLKSRSLCPRTFNHTGLMTKCSFSPGCHLGNGPYKPPDQLFTAFRHWWTFFHIAHRPWNGTAAPRIVPRISTMSTNPDPWNIALRTKNRQTSSLLITHQRLCAQATGRTFTADLRSRQETWRSRRPPRGGGYDWDGRAFEAFIRSLAVFPTGVQRAI